MWAGTATLVILAVFFVLLSLEYAKIRERQADLYQQYFEAHKLIDEVFETIGSFKEGVSADVGNFKKHVNRDMVAISESIEGYQQEIISLNNQILKVESDF